MKKKDIMAIVAAAVMAGGCSSKDEMQTQNELVPIRLTASVGMEAVTRGADGNVIETDAVVTRGLQENTLAGSEKVYVWANETGSSSWDYLKAWTLTADGSTGLTGTTKYYPANGTAITMNAVHGNFAETLTEGTTAISSLTHSVLADQNAEKGYEKSDLLFGSVTGSKASTTAENIAFTHKLSKIEVNLTAGYGYTASDIESAVVQLHNVKPTITIDPTTGNLGDASGDPITITPRKDATSGTYEAVIPPQTFANPDALISVTTNNLTLTPPARLTSTVPNTVATFNENTKYVYNVTVDILHPEIGDIYYSDGTYSKSRDANKTPIGIIVYVNDGSDIGNAATEKDVKAAGIGGHGLVLCLKNTSSSLVAWGTKDYSGVSGTNVYTNQGTYSDANLTLAIHYQGYARSQAMNNSDYIAAPLACNYTGLSAPSSSTGWFLPSAGQWRLILAGLTPFKSLGQNKGYSSQIADATYTGTYLSNLMNNALARAGADYDAFGSIVDDMYWASSQYSSAYACCLIIRQSVGADLHHNLNNDPSGHAYFIRPILAF